jgi:hypothetical protein
MTFLRLLVGATRRGRIRDWEINQQFGLDGPIL